MTWYNSSWNYRKTITVSNSGSILSDYQVSIIIDTATLVLSSKMLSNCNDIIFTSSDGSTLLNYWIESGPNTSSTKIWVKIPSIANGNNIIYLYYGNSGASATSNGTNTFEFFDDFSGTLSKWTTSTAAGGTITIGSGELQITSTTGSWLESFVYKQLPAPTNGYMAQVKIKANSTGNVQASLAFSSGTTGNPSITAPYLWVRRIYAEYAMPGVSAISGTAVSNVYDTFQIHYDGTNHYANVVGKGNATQANSGKPIYLWLSSSTFGITAVGAFDDLFVCKYTSPEPIACVGGEEVSTVSWLSNWNRRKLITITGSTNVQTDYQMKLTVHKATGTDTSTDIYLGTNVKDDFSDLRFTKNDGSTLLNYWIESYISGSLAIVWIKIPSIPIGPCTMTIYTYYSNPSATSISNGVNTFIFYDNNEAYSSGTSVTAAGWTIKSNTYIFSNEKPFTGTNSIKGSGTGGLGAYHTVGEANTPRIIEADMWDVKGSGDNYGFIYVGVGSVEQGGLGYYDNQSTTKYLAVYGGSPWYANLESTTLRSLNWHKVRFDIKDNSGSIDYWIDNVKSTTSNVGSIPNTSFDSIFLRAGTAPVYWDNVRVRKYASPEPTFSTTGTEELGITAYNMTLNTNTCAGSCQITATVTWQNLGTSSITFRPKILIDGITYAQAASDITIGPYPTTGSSSITTPTLPVGTHSICPYPN